MNTKVNNIIDNIPSLVQAKYQTSLPYLTIKCNNS